MAPPIDHPTKINLEETLSSDNFKVDLTNSFISSANSCIELMCVLLYDLPIPLKSIFICLIELSSSAICLFDECHHLELA